MRKHLILFLFLLLSLSLSAQTKIAKEISDSTSLELSKKIFRNLQTGDSDLIMKLASPEIKSSMSKEQLNSLFTSLEAQCGSYSKSEDWLVNSFNNKWLITSRLIFQNVDLKFQILLGKDSLIYGLYFKPLAKKKNNI